MITSENLSELAKALCKAQAAIMGAEKDSKNPHFNSKFSSLASVWDACREPLTQNGLSVVQALGSIDGKVNCTTMLMHESGQFIKADFAMTPQQNTPQAAGSCATYLRRYSLQAMVGVCSDDDDGNQATNIRSAPYATPTASKITTPPIPQPVLVQKTVTDTIKPAAGAAFNRANATQILQLSGYLKVKDRVNLIEEMCHELIGKEFTQTNINAAFAAIIKESK
jgi:ERF superfamily